MAASHNVTRTRVGRREFLSLVGAGALGALVPDAPADAPPAAKPRRPNVLIILLDDVGWAGIGCYGCKDIPTPSMDALARGGARFTNAYVSAPLCSPTRAGLMTGRYQQRFGHEHNPGGGAVNLGFEFGLPLTEVTLADTMRKAGYVTGIVGKWHLGQAPKYQPTARGFDEFFGFLGGAHPYFAAAAGRKGGNPIMRGKEPVEEKEYLTDAFTREAVAFIDKHKNEPFFLYLAYNATHMPMQAPQKYLDKFADIANERRRTHAAMMSCLDDGIGKVLARLKENDLEDDTLVMLVSDNGGPTLTTTSSNGPLRGYKGQVYEGGIRIPMIVRWPGRVPAGKVYEGPVISLDFAATAEAAAGTGPPPGHPLDGVDLAPYLGGTRRGAPHEYLFWRLGVQSAVRKGTWKLVKFGERPLALYDLATDMGETKDLASEKPDVCGELAKALAEWDKQLVKPLWGGKAARRLRNRLQST
jgi:arylsulfatase A-like enzyme